MGKKIVLAELQLDTAGIMKAAAETKKKMDELADAQLDLIEQGKETTKTYKSNETAMMQLYAKYQAQEAAIKASNSQQQQMISQMRDIYDGTERINQSETDYIANNQQLIALKKTLNTSDNDYQQKLALINAKLMENNNWLKENGSEHGKLVTTMNDYKSKVMESFDSINIFNGGLSGMVSRAQEAGGAGPLLKNAFNGITGGIGGMTKAAWGFVSNPIGAILTALVLVVQGLVAVFKDFTPIVDKVEQVMAGVGAVIESVKNSVIGLLTGATSLGDFFSDFAGSAAEAADEAMNLKKAQQDLADAMELQEIANEDAKKSIDGYMATAKDQTKSEQERMKALEDAQKTENDNFKQRKANAEESYRIAAQQIATGKNLTDDELKNLKEKGFAYAKELADKKSISEEELEALRKAQVERTRIYGEEASLGRKQTEELKAMQDELKAKRDQEVADELERRRKLMDDALARQKQLLALYVARNSAHSKTLAEQIKYEEEYAKKSLAVLQNELQQKKITQLQYQAEALNITSQHAANVAQAAAQFGQAELNLWMERNRSKIKSGEEVTEAMVLEEQERLGKLYKLQQDQLVKEDGIDLAKLNKKIASNQALTISEMNYLAEIERLTNEHKANMEATDQAFEESKKKKEADDIAAKQVKRDKEAQDRTLKYELEMAEADTIYEEEQVKEDERHANEVAILQQRLDDDLITDVEHKTLLTAENKKHAEKNKEIDRAVMDNKLSLASSTFGNLAAIMGKESAAGKAMAVAQATIDTYKSAVSAYSSMSGIPIVGPALGAVAAAAAVAAGIANVKKITSTKAPKAEKGALFGIGGRRHSQGGTMFTGEDGTRFEAEQGELIGVMNRNAARHFMAFNNAFPAGGGAAPNYFASGGIVSREIAPQGLNTDELAAKIAQANMMIPAPVVAVEDILSKSSSHVQIRDAANF